MIRDNHGYEYEAWLENGEHGPLFCVKEKTGKTAGKWGWHLTTLLGLDTMHSRTDPQAIPDTIYLDYGQVWWITGIRDALELLIDEIRLPGEVRIEPKHEQELPSS
jgi:hypothetical protein